MPRASALREP